MGQLSTVLSYLHSLSGPTIALLYPLYASIQALESPSKLDDEQWLAYWILYSFLSLMEMVANPVLQWIPIWYEMKVVLFAWLVLPQFRGAAFLYGKFVREKLRKSGGGMAAAAGANEQSSSTSSSSPTKSKRRFLGLVKSKKGEPEAS